MDRIILRDLKLQTVIGTFPHERNHKQELILNVEIGCDLSAAGRSDQLEDTIDYFKLEEKIVEMAAGSHFFLIERFAEAVAEICLRNPQAHQVTVSVDKPASPTRSHSMAVRIERSQNVKHGNRAS